jgi:hypothetical protein
VGSTDGRSAEAGVPVYALVYSLLLERTGRRWTGPEEKQRGSACGTAISWTLLEMDRSCRGGHSLRHELSI